MSDKETRCRALAAEGAPLLLVDRLTVRGTISVAAGEEVLNMLNILSKGPELSAARVSHAQHTVSQLRRLRGRRRYARRFGQQWQHLSIGHSV